MNKTKLQSCQNISKQVHKLKTLPSSISSYPQSTYTYVHTHTHTQRNTLSLDEHFDKDKQGENEVFLVVGSVSV